jgi:riboflavin synthase
MFTGIIEKLGTVAKVEKNGGNLELYVASDLASELKIDQSVAHNGICLTVVEIFGDRTYRVTAIEETIAKTAIGDLQEGDPINLERCMTMGARLDGHIVQGHVDQIGECTSIFLRPIPWQCYGRKRVHYGERNITYRSRLHRRRFQCCHHPLYL